MTTPPNNPDPSSGEPERPRYGENPPTPRYGQNAPGGLPPYGQNAPGGLPPYGQQPQPPYGQSPQSPYGYQQGGYPQGGYGYPSRRPGEAAPTPEPPQEVNIAFWLIIAAAAVYAITAILNLLNLNAALDSPQLDQIITQSEGTLDRNSIKGVMGTGIAVVGVIALVLYVLVAINARNGRNWARITGTVLAAVSLFNLAGGWLPILYVLLGVAGIVLLYLKPSSAYFAAVKAQKFGYGRR